MRSATRTTFVVIGLATCLGLGVVPAHGQMTLLSTTPPDGTAGVALNATFAFEFSEPLDMDAQLGSDGSFIVGGIFPEIQEEPVFDVSEDGKTLSIQFPLEPDTKYNLILLAVRSTTGAMLDGPHVTTFSTAGSLPTASFAGTVNFPGDDPTGTVVFFFRSEDAGFVFADNSTADGLAVVSDVAGSFEAPYLHPGKYWAIATKDISADYELLDDLTDDAVAFYDADGDGEADPLVIGPGETVSGVIFSLHTIVPFTASEYTAQAAAAAVSAYPDAELTAIVAPIDLDGYSGDMTYVFHSQAAGSQFGVLMIGQQRIFAPFQLTDWYGPPIDLTMPLPQSWVDSEAALQAAGPWGGNDFKARFPMASAWVTLANVDLGNTTSAAAMEKSSSATSMSRPIWWINYDPEEDTDEYLNVAVDAISGLAFRPDRPMLNARMSLSNVAYVALNWTSDARLISVRQMDFEGVRPDGVAQAWEYSYYSQVGGVVRKFYVSGGMVDYYNEEAPDSYPSLTELPEGWLDSPPALLVAEGQSNGFRAAYQDATVSATLGVGRLESRPEQAVWEFRYFASTADLTIYIDAATGAVVTSTDDESLPKAFSLRQNFPNPFNPSTTITYTLDSGALVSLTVFDLLGRTVRTLLEATSQPPGTYAVVWNGRDDAELPVASGTYLYRLETSAGSVSRSMVVIK